MPNIPIDLLIRYGLQILGAFVIFAIGLLLAKWAGDFAYKALLKQEMEPPIRTLLVRILKIVVLAFTLVVALDQFGVQVAPLIAGIGSQASASALRCKACSGTSWRDYPLSLPNHSGSETTSIFRGLWSSDHHRYFFLPR